jgi:hypothetical protein
MLKNSGKKKGLAKVTRKTTFKSASCFSFFSVSIDDHSYQQVLLNKMHQSNLESEQ